MIDQLIRSAPADESLYITAAQFYLKQKEVSIAEATLERGVTANPESIKLRLAQSRLFAETRKMGKALSTVEECLSLRKDPDDPEILQAKVMLASLYFDSGDMRQSADFTDQVIAVSPKDVQAQYVRGQIYLREGDGLNAVSALRIVTAEKPSDLQSHVLLAQAYMINKEISLAKDTLIEMIQNHPHPEPARRLLARIYALEKRWDDAEYELNEIVKSRPTDPRPRGDLGDLLLAAGETDRAGKAYLALVENHPDVPAGYAKLAFFYGRNEHWPQAVAIMEKAYARMPQRLPVLATLIQVYVAGGQTEKAENLLRQRLSENDQDAAAHNLLGEIQLQKKQFVQAEASFKKATVLAPEWQAAYDNLSRSYLAQGKQDQAVANLQASIEKNSKNKAAYLTLGYLLQISHRQQEAIAVYEKALDALPDLWPAANNLAYLLVEDKFDQTQADKALAMAERALELQPENPTVRDTLGWVHYQRGDVDQALTELDQAYSLDPDNTIINFHLGMALFKSNRRLEARRSWKQPYLLIKHSPAGNWLNRH